MTVLERAAYLRGLFEGLGMDAETNEGKLFQGMLSCMEEMAQGITDLQEQNKCLLDELDDIYEEMSAITEDFLDKDSGFSSNDQKEPLYQVICPNCGELIYLDDEMLEAGSISCSACGEELEFDLTELQGESEGK